MIEVKNLEKWYGPTHAVRGVTFRLEPGQVTGFLGPNGAGKSTTMKIVTGFLFADSGEASIGGHDVVKDPLGARRHLGYLPEHNPLYEEMAVVDYLEFAAKARGVSLADRPKRIRAAVDGTGLGEVLHKGIGELSKGYRQRVGLAQALVHDPPVLILDEPTSGLDPNQRREILDLIKDIGREKTVIHSTHVLDEVRHTCSRVLIIHRGKLVADGTPDSITRQHQGDLVVRVALVAPSSEARQALSAISGIKSIEDAPEDYFDPTAELVAAPVVAHVAEKPAEKTSEKSPAKKGKKSKVAPTAAPVQEIAVAENPRVADPHHPAVFRITLKAGKDARREIAALAGERHWPLMELALERASIETIFQRLTADR